MAIHRGIQSAIFFYLSCAPCAEARYRKKRKEEAERGRAEREAIAMEMPHVYRHPSPSSTNPHWQTEIVAGPALVSRGRKKMNTTDARRGLKTSMTQHSNESQITSSVDLSSNGGNGDGRNDSKLYFQRFQREDDELWGSPSVERLESGITLDGSTHSHGIARPPRVHTRGSDTASSYSTYRNPAINDLHPATVTKLNSREEAMWMMQPPPTADVMSGKSRAPRSRSDSGGSSRFSARSGVPLSREVSQRMIERKLRNGDTPSLALTMSRESSSQATNDPKGQRHDRSRVDEKDFAEMDDRPGSEGKGRQRPSQTQISDHSADSNATVVHSPDQAPEPLTKQQSRRVASKPQLSTIVSDSVAASDEEGNPPSRRSKENSAPSAHQSDTSLTDLDRISRCSAILAKDDSLKVIRDLAPEPAILKAHVVSSDDLRRSSRKSSRQQSHDASEDKQLEDAKLFDSWYNPDFVIPDWVHEHTKREVRQRWSMDF